MELTHYGKLRFYENWVITRYVRIGQSSYTRQHPDPFQLQASRHRHNLINVSRPEPSSLPTWRLGLMENQLVMIQTFVPSSPFFSELLVSICLPFGFLLMQPTSSLCEPHYHLPSLPELWWCGVYSVTVTRANHGPGCRLSNAFTLLSCSYLIYCLYTLLLHLLSFLNILCCIFPFSTAFAAGTADTGAVVSTPAHTQCLPPRFC